MLSNNISAFSDIGGLFIYSEKTDIYIPQFNAANDTIQNNTDCSQIILDLLREGRAAQTLDEINMNNWFFIDINGNFFAVRIIKIYSSYAGAWTNINQIYSSFTYFTDLDATVLFVDASGAPIGNAEFSQDTILPEQALTRPSIYKAQNNRQYLTVASALDYCDYYIVALIPKENISQIVSPLYTLLAITILIFALFALSTVLIVNRSMNSLNDTLIPVIQSMRQGTFDAKIQRSSRYQDINNVIATFNNMIDEIQHLRINVYEEKLSRKEMEIQYLKSQIAPHFLINCLNTIFELSTDMANQEVMHKIIRYLSEHLRYTLSSQTTVSISEEMHFVENYLLLTSLRFPRCISYEFTMDADAKDLLVFPLLILMLTENSVKANITMGEEFRIMIRIGLYESQGEPRVRITHIDSGTGFTESNLSKYNNILAESEVRKDGYEIGIYNIIRRLKLLLGDSSKIEFTNELGYGARIDIDFPAMVYNTGSSLIKEQP